MRQIINADIADIAPYDQGFVYSEKVLLENGSCKISFFSYDCELNLSTPITKKTYSELKFGKNGNTIANELGQNGEFIFSDCTRFYNDLVVTLDGEGNFSIFSSEGIKLKKSKLTFKGSPICSPAAYEKTLWCVVPEKNTIINYSLEQGKFIFKIGGENLKYFAHPESLSLIDNKIYICNRDSGRIRKVTIEGNTYSITDFLAFYEPVYKYFRVGDKEYALLESGLYEL